MNNLDSLRSDFNKDWNSVGVYHGKGLVADLPSWEDVLGILNNAARDKDPQVNQSIKASAPFEIIYKDMLANKTIRYDKEDINIFDVESEVTFFFSLFFNQDTFGSVISESVKNQTLELDKLLNIKSEYSSLKISIADKFVPYESHEWDTCILHLAGTTEWRLKGGTHGAEKLYVLEPGDILLFKEGVEHELTNEKPRSSLVGRFILGDSHE